MKTKLVLFILFIIINAIVYFITEINKTNKIDIALNTHTRQTTTAYNSIKYNQKIIIDNTIEFLKYSSKEIFNKLPNSSEKEKKVLQKQLYKNLKNKFIEIQKKGVSKVLISLPNNKILLNTKNPNIYNNDLNEFKEAIKYVNQTKKEISGFEKDLDDYAYRYARPIFNELNQFIGTIEISFSLEQIQNYFIIIDNLDTHILINKNQFFIEWNKDEKKYVESAENSDYISFHSSFHKKEIDIEENRKKLNNYLQNIKEEMTKSKIFNIYKKHEDEEHHKDSFYSEHIDVITFLPIKSTNNKILTWVVFYNLDNFISETLIHVKIFRIISLVLLSILLILLYKTLNKKNELTKQVEEKVNELDSYFNLIKDGIAVADVETKRFIDCNKSFEILTGYSKEELKLFTIDKIHPKESLDYVFKVFKDQAKGNKKIALNIPILSKTGKVVMTDASTGTFNRDNQSLNIAIFRNIEDRLELENKLKKFNKKLEEKVETQIQELREKDNMLFQQNKMAALGEMLGNIAHQWRQPLSAITTAATGAKIQKEVNCLSDEELNVTFDTINETAQYLSKTIEDFRYFFNPSNIKINSFYISKTIERTLNIMTIHITKKNIKLIKDIEDIKLSSIENELMQVLINILDNAKDALEQKDDEIKLLFIKTYQKDENLIIEIKDNGNGIDEEIIGKIFEPYFTTKHQSQGTGIGLYMSSEITRNHLKGEVIVKNDTYEYDGKSYRGAKFTISIPIFITK